MTIAELIQHIRSTPNSVDFQHVIATINSHYEYQPTRFHNGVGTDRIDNAAGANEGSCRVFAFAQLHQLSEAETLACFGQFYRDVASTPDGSDHANIRTFLRHGWAGINFDAMPLTAKA